jgi:hypothetical protein
MCIAAVESRKKLVSELVRPISGYLSFASDHPRIWPNANPLPLHTYVRVGTPYMCVYYYKQVPQLPMTHMQFLEANAETPSFPAA